MNNKDVIDLSKSSLSYLEKHRVKFYLEDALAQLLANKEEVAKTGPAKFLADYFFSVHRGTHTLLREYSYLHATSHNRRNFIRTVWSCFRNVATYGAELLSMKEYHSLLSLVCSDFPFDVIQKTARIVLIDDAHDCLMSFVDFLFALQLQIFYQEFIEAAKESYEYALCGKKPPVKVPSGSEDWYDSNVVAARHNEGVACNLFLEAVRKVCRKLNEIVERPPMPIIEQELSKLKKITFYSFLMSLSKNPDLNRQINVLPAREKLFDGRDVDLFENQQRDEAAVPT